MKLFSLSLMFVMSLVAAPRERAATSICEGPIVVTESTSLDQNQRQGKQSGASFSVPMGLSCFEVTVPIAPADRTRVGNTVTIRVYSSTDNGATWHFEGGSTWKSGIVNPKTGEVDPPGHQIDPTCCMGKLVYVELDIPVRLNAGAQFRWGQ